MVAPGPKKKQAELLPMSDSWVLALQSNGFHAGSHYCPSHCNISWSFGLATLHGFSHLVLGFSKISFIAMRLLVCTLVCCATWLSHSPHVTIWSASRSA